MPQNIQHSHGTRSFPCSIAPFHRSWATHGKQPATIQEMAWSSRATAKLTATYTLNPPETRTRLEAQNPDPATEHRQWLSSWGQAGHAERQWGRWQVLRWKRPGKQEKKNKPAGEHRHWHGTPACLRVPQNGSNPHRVGMPQAQVRPVGYVHAWPHLHWRVLTWRHSLGLVDDGHRGGRRQQGR